MESDFILQLDEDLSTSFSTMFTLSHVINFCFFCCVIANPMSWCRCCPLQEPDSRLWPYVYPSKYSEAPKPQEEDRWKEDRERERDRKGKEERSRLKEGPQKEEGKEDGRTHLPLEEHRGPGKEARPPHMQFSPMAQHQSYMSYMHAPYAYSQAYEPNHPGYRGMPSVMMQNYPGKWQQVAGAKR